MPETLQHQPGTQGGGGAAASVTHVRQQVEVDQHSLVVLAGPATRPVSRHSSVAAPQLVAEVLHPDTTTAQ